MEVNFDQLRLNLIRDYNSLCFKLKDAVKDKSTSPEIIIDPAQLEEEMKNIRQGIVILSCLEQKGQSGFNSIENVDVDSFNWED